MNRSYPFEIVAMPRQSLSWSQFLISTPPNSIALDGIVHGGPNFDPVTKHLNFDHHDGVVREATMSTAMQIFFAIKGGLMEMFKVGDKITDPVFLYINDTDQDTSLAIWLLINYQVFEGNSGLPNIHRLLTLTDRLDITGGAFPMNLRGELEEMHAWVFGAYNDLRKSGGLAIATAEILQDNLAATINRLNKFMMGEGERQPLDTRHEIIFDSPEFKIIDEIGGNEARYHLFGQGLKAFISIVTHRPDGRSVCSIGRRSRYIPFPVTDLYDDFNAAEGLNRETGWNGSDIIGGSSRKLGTGLSIDELKRITLTRLKSM